jgi:signal transduction histidine kinase
VGGVPPSRLPLLIGLFGTSVGLTLVTVLLLRRQQVLVRMRTDFVSSVSHELRTPLAQIRLLAELLHLGRPADESGRRRAARIIDQEARRLTYLVENILAFSRGERGATRLAPAPLDVRAEVADVLEMFAPLATAAGSTVELRDGECLTAIVDGAALRQILLNFLDNAIRYGPTGQTVQVGVEPIRPEDGWSAVSIWVEDEGPGVPTAERGRIWDPYYRLARDAVVTAGGSGIGLAVVRELTHRHGGRVWVEDARGRHQSGKAGARFVVAFPDLGWRATPNAEADELPQTESGVEEQGPKSEAAR